MPKKSIGNPVWSEKRKHWRMSAQKNGIRRDFYSSNPSRKMGPAECRKKAEAWLHRLENPSDIYFEEAWNEYLEYYEAKYKLTSLSTLESRAKAHLLPALKNRKLVTIQKTDWQNIIFRAFEHESKSKATLKGLATTIRTFCKWASTKGYMRDTDVPIYFAYPTEKLSREKKILQPDELAALLSPEEEESNWYINAFRFLALTGLRRGELCALQLKRDYDKDSITIRESISHEGYLTDGKTKDAHRTIYLGDLAKDIIHKHEMQLMKIGKRNRTYLFCNEYGQRISPRVLRNNWQEWREAHGIDITLHELRHTFISYSRLKTGISLDELKRIYGHSAGMNTDKVYVHSIDESPEERRKKLEADMSNARKIDQTIEKLIESI